MTIKECLENGTISLEDEVDYNDTEKGEETACLKLEIDRLNNIINKLEQWLKNQVDISYSNIHTLNKLKELKEESQV